jgi:regulatory protein
MPQVSDIKPQKNKKRVNIYLDGKFAFGIDLDNLVKLDLKVEQELSDEEVADIIKKAEFQKTLDKLLRFATLRPRSEKEIWKAV